MLRGATYLKLRQGNEAAQEFKKIIDHRGVDALSPYYALAQLGLGRAFAIADERSKAQRAYEEFFSDGRMLTAMYQRCSKRNLSTRLFISPPESAKLGTSPRRMPHFLCNPMHSLLGCAIVSKANCWHIAEPFVALDVPIL